jgi:uncharacterized protein (TIGR02678 family)
MKHPDPQTEYERRQALRSLLRTPMIRAVGPRARVYRWIRMHHDWLSEWLGRNTGWRLVVNREVARLYKTPPDLDDATRSACDSRSRDTPFSRRCYVFLCLALAALERAERQITIGRLLEGMKLLAAEDPALAAAGIEIEMLARDVRRDLVRAALLLQDLGVLSRVDGDEAHYVQGAGDVLYNIHRPALAAMLGVRRGPSTIAETSFEARLAAVVEEPQPDSPEGRNQRVRHRLTRALLDDPVLYLDDLGSDELAYLQSQRSKIVGEIAQATGLVPEIRREGIAMADEDGDLSDIGLPEEGTLGHLTLLIAEFLAALAKERPGQPLSMTEVIHHTAGLIEEHAVRARRWNNSAREPDAERTLADAVITRLAAMRLVRRIHRRDVVEIVPLPAIHRFAIAAPGATSAAARPARRARR